MNAHTHPHMNIHFQRGHTNNAWAHLSMPLHCSLSPYPTPPLSLPSRVPDLYCRTR